MMTRFAPALALLLVACGAPPPAPVAPSSAPMVSVPLANDDAPPSATTRSVPDSPNAIQPQAPAPRASDDFVFPDAAGWQKLEFHRYDQPELGVSLGYRFANEGGQATVFVYDDGVTHVPDDVEAAVVSDQFAQARAEIDYAAKRGMYKEVSLIGARLVHVGPQAMHHAHYRLVTPKGLALGSDIYLFTFGGRFLKVRVSYDETIARSASRGIEVLLQALVDATARPPQA